MQINSTINENFKIKLSKIFHKEFYTPKDLVKIGLFGGKSSIHRMIKQKKLKIFFATERRILVCKDDLIEYIITNNLIFDENLLRSEKI